MTDAELLDRLRRGDETAREALLVRHAPAILRWARARCRADDADDVAQDALVAVAKGVGTVQDGAALLGWLRAVTRNTCARRRRPRAGAPAVLDPVDDEQVAADLPGPEEAAADAERRDTVRAAIGRLDDKYREILILRDVEGLTAPEVAERTGLRIEAVKTRLHRARAALRELVAPSARGPACPDLGVTFSRYLEGELDAGACAALEAHVSACPACGPACDTLRSAIVACRREDDPPPDVLERVRRALRAATRTGA